MNRHYGWTVWGIIGFCFIPVSLVLLGSGAIVHAAKPGATARILMTTFGIIGGTFLALGAGFLFIDLRRRYRMRRAFLGGNAVTARVTGILTVNNVNMNGAHPVIVECEYQGNRYRSRYLYRNVPEVGSEVTVYIDRIDDRIGYVDL